MRTFRFLCLFLLVLSSFWCTGAGAAYLPTSVLTKYVVDETAKSVMNPYGLVLRTAYHDALEANVMGILSSRPTSQLGAFLIDAASIEVRSETAIGAATIGEAVIGSVGQKVILRDALAFLGPVGVVATIALSAKDVYDWANASPANKAYFNGPAVGDTPNSADLTHRHAVGDIVTKGGNAYKLVSGGSYDSGGFYNGDPNMPSAPSVNTISGVTYFYDYFPISSTKWSYATWVTNYSPYPQPANIASGPYSDFEDKLGSNLQGTAVGSNLAPQSQSGVDRAIMAKAQKQNIQPSSADLQYLAQVQQAKDAATNLANATADRNAELQRQLDAAKSGLALNPTDQALKDKVDELQRTIDANNQAAAKDAAAAASDAATPMPNSSPDALHKFDWTPFNRLKGALAAAWPFSLLGGVVSTLSVLSSTPTAPVFDLPLVYGNVHCDLAVFDGVATLCRWLFGLLLTVGAYIGVNNYYRGVS